MFGDSVEEFDENSLFFRGPKPHFFWGNLPDINTWGVRTCMIEWHRKYGDVFGIFYGIKPFLCITDPEILKRIEIQEFAKFTDKDVSFELSLSSTNTTIYPIVVCRFLWHGG
ncbi:CYP3A4 [Cordylochernes scorpioides]|uniref:CYP3A4 n=1 Tax=Cordylochernes scorpioides TaxID=51811 RepID=A0ABY6LHJ2_9ARAC|nr:CYP3A4 [Cordylochernes scorpioides]